MICTALLNQGCADAIVEFVQPVRLKLQSQSDEHPIAGANISTGRSYVGEDRDGNRRTTYEKVDGTGQTNEEGICLLDIKTQAVAPVIFFISFPADPERADVTGRDYHFVIEQPNRGNRLECDARLEENAKVAKEELELIVLSVGKPARPIRTTAP
jgi:hypothetical protein